MKKLDSIFRQMRAYRGITQSELSEKSGVARSTISLIEKGKYNPSLDTLKSLTDTLNCKLEINIVPIEEVG